MSLMSMSHVTYINESRHANEWVMSHIWLLFEGRVLLMKCVLPFREACHTLEHTQHTATHYSALQHTCDLSALISASARERSCCSCATRSSSRELSAACCGVMCVAVCCSVLQCVAVCRSVLQRVTVCCNMLQCVAVCCSVLQCVAVLVLQLRNKV